MSNNLMFELLNGDVDLGKFCDWIAGKETQVIWTKVLVLCLNVLFSSIELHSNMKEILAQQQLSFCLGLGSLFYVVLRLIDKWIGPINAVYCRSITGYA